VTRAAVVDREEPVSLRRRGEVALRSGLERVGRGMESGFERVEERK
jgi:hypothetical protein